MKLLVWLCCALLACSSKAADDRASKSSEPTPSSPQTTVTDVPAKDARASACRNNGDGAVCMVAGDHALKAEKKHVAFELYALACARGHGAGCAANAKPSRTPSMWHGRACRRGHQPSCGMTDGWAAELRGRAKANATFPSWLANEYERAIEDCAAGLPKALREAAGSVSLTVDKDEISVVAVEPGAMASCVANTVKTLRRPTSGSHALVVTLSVKN